MRLEPRETKNDDARTVYLDQELMNLFKTQWQFHKENARKGKILPWVFLNEECTDQLKNFRKAWKTACIRAGLGVRLFHALGIASMPP